MIKKKIIYLFLLIFISQCGYNPIYINNKNIKINLEIVNTYGDQEINDLIIKKLNLKEFQDKNNEKKMLISFNSNYKKDIIGKNLKGISSDYQIKVSLSATITLNDIERSIDFIEKMDIKKLSDPYEQEKYELTIKKSLSESISEKLIFYLLNFR